MSRSTVALQALVAAVAVGASEFLAHMRGGGVLAHALDSRVRGVRGVRGVDGALRRAAWHRSKGGGGILSFSHLSARIPSLFCAQPWDAEWSCAAFDVVLSVETNPWFRPD